MSRWTAIYTNLSHLDGLHIPRWTGFETNKGRAELHGFADASSHAYVAAVYLKFISPCQQVTVTLLIGKSRVAPLKTLSIPRLELSAAVLLANLVSFVRASLGFEVLPCYCWTDSTITLAWVTQHPSKWKTFVANRVAEIQSIIPDVEWRHVDTATNPADCASRGISGAEMSEHTLWWRGPSWLQSDKREWPNANPTLPLDTAILEEKTVSLLGTITPTINELAERFSSWPRLLRVTAYILRFIQRCRCVGHDQIPTGIALCSGNRCSETILDSARSGRIIFKRDSSPENQSYSCPKQFYFIFATVFRRRRSHARGRPNKQCPSSLRNPASYPARATSSRHINRETSSRASLTRRSTVDLKYSSTRFLDRTCA